MGPHEYEEFVLAKLESYLDLWSLLDNMQCNALLTIYLNPS
jgi:hypothetical protein